ncbi:MAG: sulfotransferase, partial [Actinomycetales bacterium]
MPAPTFLCIGAQKCGTTWLASAVAQHPEVGTGRKKELHFFDQRAAYERGLDWYESQF